LRKPGVLFQGVAARMARKELLMVMQTQPTRIDPQPQSASDIFGRY
jgi:hypothetical protein